MSRVTTYLVGRDPRCDCRLDDPSVSRRHAEVIPGPDGRLYVIDRASTGGTFVWSGREWAPVRQAWVGPADRIRFGAHEMVAADLAIPFGGGAAAASDAGPAPEPNRKEPRLRTPARDPETGEVIEAERDDR